MPKEISQKEVDKKLGEELSKVKEMMLDLPTSLQDDMVARVIDDVKLDEAARKEYMERRVKVLDAIEGKKTPKSDPFVNCANVKTRVTAMVSELLHAKLFPAVYNDELTYWIPQEKSDVQTAENVGKFMRWALRSMKFATFVDDFVRSLVNEGSNVTKVRWEAEWKWVQRKIPKTDTVIKRIKNVLLNMMGRRVSKKVNEVDYDIIYDYKKFEKCTCELVPLEDVGFPFWGIPGGDEDKLRHIWHRTRPYLSDLKLKEESGYFINVSKIDEQVEKPLIAGTEKAKMDAEGSRQVDLKKENTPLEQVEWYGKWNIPNMGFIEVIIWIESKTKTFLGAMPLVNVSRICKRPFVIGQLVRRPNRMLGSTPVDIACEIEEEINTIHNQRLDAGTMSIIPIGLYRAASGFTPEDIQIRPGLWIPVDDIDDAKYLTMPNNTLVSFQEEKMLLELVEKVTSAGAYQAGQESMQNRTKATKGGTLALIQQGEQRFQVLAKGTQQPLSKVLTHILQNWQQNAPAGMEERILGDTGDPIFPEGLSPEDIAGNYDNYTTLEATGGSKQMEMQIAAMIYEAFMQNPLTQSNPAYIWQVSADALRAAGKVEVERYIGPKPKLPLDIAKGVNEENMLLLQNRQVKVSPMDNVMEHVLGHMYFRESPQGMSMTPEALQKLDAHIQETKMQLLQAMQQQASVVPETVEMTGAEGGQGGTVGPAQGTPGVGSVENAGAQTQPGGPAGAGPGTNMPGQGGIQGVPSGIGPGQGL